MKSMLMLGALGVVTMLFGQVGFVDSAQAARDSVSDSPAPVDVLSEEDINQIIDRRVDLKLEEIMRGKTQVPPPKDFSQMPGMGQTSQSQVRGVQQRKAEGVDWVTGGSVLQGGRTIYAKPFVRAPRQLSVVISTLRFPIVTMEALEIVGRDLSLIRNALSRSFIHKSQIA